MKKRESGIDLLRCLAFLFVVTFHSFLNNGYYSEPQTGVLMLAANSFRWLSVSCIGIFIMITGYLKAEEEPGVRYYRGLPQVLMCYLIASAVSIPIRHFYFGDVKTMEVWVKSLFNFSGVYYGWYVRMYVGLLLLSPIINLALCRLNSKKGYICIAVSMLIVTALPGATEYTFFPSYWRAAYPLTYYALGAMVRRLQPVIKPWVGISIALATAILMGAATLASTDGGLSQALTWEFGDIWVVIIAFFLFLALYRLKIKGRAAKLLSWLAGGCYGGYLLSHLLDGWVYKKIPEWHDPSRYIKLFILVTAPIYIISIIAGKLCGSISNCILYPFSALSKRYKNKKSSRGRY